MKCRIRLFLMIVFKSLLNAVGAYSHIIVLYFNNLYCAYKYISLVRVSNAYHRSYKFITYANQERANQNAVKNPNI